MLGLRILEESPYACALDAHGTVLRLTPVHEHVRAPNTVLGWTVSDIAATTSAIGTAGVALLRFEGMDQDELGVWTAPGGARVAWFSDPDGNVLSVTEQAS